MTARIPGLSIRPARPDEYPAVGELSLLAYTARYGEQTPDYTQRLIRPQDRTDTGEIWVAVTPGGEVVGTVTIGRELHDDELNFGVLATSPAVGRQGVGQALLGRVFAVARDRGATRISMGTGSTMTTAHGLYLKNGFRRAPERDHILNENGRTVTVWRFMIDVADDRASPPRG